ncbi:DUF6804 family protein [Agromyces humi]|uniref:DUF6804 family protein n=1 Tax=Agromyces humi TaxID=1766800 RepID=UPI001356E098|nr:DUF6804 family protein [Agromyces humi]
MTTAPTEDTKPRELTAIERRPALLPAAIGAVTALSALGAWPYEYYEIVRISVCVISALVAVCALSGSKDFSTSPGSQKTAIVLSAASALFWFAAGWWELPRTTWMVFDVITAVLLVIAGTTAGPFVGTKTKPWAYYAWGAVALAIVIGTVLNASSTDGCQEYERDSRSVTCVG